MTVIALYLSHLINSFIQSSTLNVWVQIKPIRIVHIPFIYFTFLHCLFVFPGGVIWCQLFLTRFQFL